MIETNFATANNEALHDAAQRLLDAAMAYWEVYQRATGGAAVVWLKDTSGRMVVLTRGEYRDVLMRNIDTLLRDNDTVNPFHI